MNLKLRAWAKSLIAKRITSLVKLYDRLSSDPLAFNHFLLFLISTVLSFPAAWAIFRCLGTETVSVPLLLFEGDLVLSTWHLVFFLRSALLSVIFLLLLGNYTFRKAGQEWDRSLPFPVALLNGVVHSPWIGGLYGKLSVASVIIVGSNTASPLLAVSVLLLWELFFASQLLFCHLQSKEYGIPLLYAAYASARTQQTLIAVGGSVLGTALGFSINQLGEARQTSLREQGATLRNEVQCKTNLEVAKTNLEVSKTNLEVSKTNLEFKKEENRAVELNTASQKEKNWGVELERSWWPRKF